MFTPASSIIFLYLVLSIFTTLRLEYLLPSHYLDYNFSTINAVLQLNQLLCVITMGVMIIGQDLLILFSVSCLPTCLLYLDG